MMGMRNSRCTLYESEVVTSLLNNSGSWIGLTDKIVDKLQDFKNKFMMRFFEAPKKGTPTGIVFRLKYAPIEEQDNIKQADIHRKSHGKGKDLLTECENWRRELQIKNFKKGAWTQTQ